MILFQDSYLKFGILALERLQLNPSIKATQDGGLTKDNIDDGYVNIASGNGLLPDCTKPLLEPMMIYYQ